MTKHIFIVLIIFILAKECLGQNAGVLASMPLYSESVPFDSLVAAANLYSENNPAEKVYLHFDRSAYFQGEDCWYKAYIVDDILGATNISSVLYVDWIDPSGNLISHKRLKIQDGGAVGDFTIDTALHEGIYSVRAYTNWMRNNATELFFSRQIQVIDPMEPNDATDNTNDSLNIDLQFFPEGGTLIAGVKALVAYKAIDVNGRGIEVRGRVVDEQNNLITTFKSSKMGMGAFPFVGDLKKSFHAILDNGEAFNLPRPSPTGISLAASNMNAEAVLLQIQRRGADESVMHVIGQSRGTICFAETISMNNHIKEIAISRKQLPEGVVQFTLLNSRGVPQCERMLFIKKAETIIVNVTSSNKRYLPRDSVMLRVEVADHNRKPMQTSLSVSVTEADFAKITPSSENIYTQLLLQSDLKGNVENPAWYFESDTPDHLYALDLVMLTHGWSKYDWNKIIGRQKELSFLPESGITMKGQVLANKKPIVNTPFIFMIPDSAQSAVGIYETDSLGFFDITGLDFSDSTLIEWRVMKKKGTYANRTIQLIQNEKLPSVGPSYTNIQSVTIPDRQSYHKILEAFNKTGVWNFGSRRMLEEVEVKAKRINVVSVGMNREIVVPTPEDLSGVTGQFANRYAPGISAARLVRISEDQEIWTLPSGGQIIVSIDGYIRSPYDFPMNPFLLLNTVGVNEVEYIAISGDPHNGYFIDLKTKDPSKLEPPGIIKQLVKGYDVAREFYHPKYGPKDISSIGPDNRITLYWNPSLSTDENGIATIKFYNNDITEKIQIVVEGIANGKPISLVQTFEELDKE